MYKTEPVPLHSGRKLIKGFSKPNCLSHSVLYQSFNTLIDEVDGLISLRMIRYGFLFFLKKNNLFYLIVY